MCRTIGLCRTLGLWDQWCWSVLWQSCWKINQSMIMASGDRRSIMKMDDQIQSFPIMEHAGTVLSEVVKYFYILPIWGPQWLINLNVIDMNLRFQQIARCWTERLSFLWYGHVFAVINHHALTTYIVPLLYCSILGLWSHCHQLDPPEVQMSSSLQCSDLFVCQSLLRKLQQITIKTNDEVR